MYDCQTRASSKITHERYSHMLQRKGWPGRLRVAVNSMVGRSHLYTAHCDWVETGGSNLGCGLLQG